MPQPRLTAADLTTFFLAGIAGIVAANLTYLALFSGSEAILDTLHPLLMPGLLGAYALHSNPDGTIVLAGITPFLAVFLNAATYAFAIMVPRLLWSHVSRSSGRELGRLSTSDLAEGIFASSMERRLQTRLEELI